MSGGRARIARRFQALAAEGRAAFIPFISAGDPDRETSSAILARLPGLGADLIELGMPFSDPMADGPSIQAAGERALAAGQTMADTLEMAASFRAADAETPLVLMGYFNPIYRYGAEAFAADARAAGVDGLIVVDLPPEEDAELRVPAEAAGLALIRLVAPTTDDARLGRILAGCDGFVYYVSVTGITGTKSAMTGDIAAGLERIRKATDLPVAVGFGVRDAGQAAEIASFADAVVVGSAIVQRIESSLVDGKAASGTVAAVAALVRELAGGVRNGRPRDGGGSDG
ncbi:MAG: tryptophan synthase subunit alpha [Defluviicoccus sp.]|nr:tryptophan synthase subunit alpha [Defluviicoccus sp.]